AAALTSSARPLVDAHRPIAFAAVRSALTEDVGDGVARCSRHIELPMTPLTTAVGCSFRAASEPRARTKTPLLAHSRPSTKVHHGRKAEGCSCPTAEVGSGACGRTRRTCC